MATLYKRGKIWWARWYRRNGTRTQASTKTTKRRDAERIGAELESSDRRKDLAADKHATAYTQILNDAVNAAQRGDLDAKEAEKLLLRIRRVSNPDFKIPSLFDVIEAWAKDQDKRGSRTGTEHSSPPSPPPPRAR